MDVSERHQVAVILLIGIAAAAATSYYTGGSASQQTTDHPPELAEQRANKVMTLLDAAYRQEFSLTKGRTINGSVSRSPTRWGYRWEQSGTDLWIGVSDEQQTREDGFAWLHIGTRLPDMGRFDTVEAAAKTHIQEYTTLRPHRAACSAGGRFGTDNATVTTCSVNMLWNGTPVQFHLRYTTDETPVSLSMSGCLHGGAGCF